MKKIRILIVDDSALVREILSQGLNQDPELEVVGTAANPYIARDKIIALNPDVLTLDVEMPRMDGVDFLRRLMPQHPVPVIMVSSITQRGTQMTFEALEAGAVDFVTKPSTDIARGLNQMLSELRQKIKVAAGANLSMWQERVRIHAKPPRFISEGALPESTDKVIAIGASTGGTEAIRRVVRQFPADMPGVVVVQHMPAGFTKHFADGLNEVCEMEVVEAKTGDRVMRGRVLIAPGGKHMRMRRFGGTYLVDCQEGENVNGHCPSVDVLFCSVARYVGANAVGVVLTGMGADGANGLVEMRTAGARTVVQDEGTSVIFGMPKVAYERGGAERMLPLDMIPKAVIGLLGGGKI
jgi:two-component system, chemotaxis family, protein-glutamate methylesterase/glutaminase